MAELAVFDYTLRYRSGRIYQNGDALSRQQQPLDHVVVGPSCPGTPVPVTVQTALVNAKSIAQHAVSAVPERSNGDLVALQRADPAIGAVLSFYQQQQMPGWEERQGLHPAALGLLRQWDCVTLRDVLLYRTFQRCVLQLVLPENLRDKVFTQQPPTMAIKAVSVPQS